LAIVVLAGQQTDEDLFADLPYSSFTRRDGSGCKRPVHESTQPRVVRRIAGDEKRELGRMKLVHGRRRAVASGSWSQPAGDVLDARARSECGVEVERQASEEEVP